MIRIFNKYHPIHKILFFFIEAICILSFVFGWSFYMWSHRFAWYDLTLFILPYALIYTFFCQVSFHFFGLYEYRSQFKRIDTLIRLTAAIIVADILFSAFHYFLPHEIVKRKLIIVTSMLVLLNGNFLRYIYFYFLESRKKSEKVLILGSGSLAKDIARFILTFRRDLAFKVVGFLDEDKTRLGVSILNPSIIGTYEDVFEIARSLDVDRIIVALEDKRGKLPLDELMKCKTQGKKVEDCAHFYEHLMGKLYIENLPIGDIIFSDGFHISPTILKLKRTVDIIGAAFMMFLISPLIILIAMLIKLESRGSILFRQERFGKDGKIFNIYKFRTMREDAELTSGPVWALEKDPRITKVGRLLRKTRIDEIPQFWNVLKGEMSFVGPRPERPFFVEKLKREIPYYLLRTSVKPGITGWAQIKYKYGASIEDAKEKLRYDLYYIKNLSLMLDMCIIWQTIKVVLFGKGAK